MRELTTREVEVVNGGLSWGEGAGIVFSLSLYSPVTAAFGLPIGAAMVIMDLHSN